MMQRRGFLGAMLAAPAVVRSGVLMPVRPTIIVPAGWVSIREYASGGLYEDVIHEAMRVQTAASMARITEMVRYGVLRKIAIPHPGDALGELARYNFKRVL